MTALIVVAKRHGFVQIFLLYAVLTRGCLRALLRAGLGSLFDFGALLRCQPGQDLVRDGWRSAVFRGSGALPKTELDVERVSSVPRPHRATKQECDSKRNVYLHGTSSEFLLYETQHRAFLGSAR